MKITAHCAAYISDAADSSPADPKPDPKDPGAGSGGGTAAPGSKESCDEVADEVSRLVAELEYFRGLRDQQLFNYRLREQDFATLTQSYVRAVNASEVKRLALATAKADAATTGESSTLEFDGNGKPMPNRKVLEAERQLGAAYGVENQARLAATDAARLLNDSTDRLAALERGAIEADPALAAALARQAKEKCKP